MKQSVVVCTRNRAASLARALDSLARAEPPRRAAWQVVIVDNGSSDDTQEVIARFRNRLPLRAVLEAQPGISNARNAGVAAADGDYLLWTDDDVTVCRGWLRSYESAFEAHPGAAFFGGPVAPRFVAEPPRWLREALPQVLSAYGGVEIPEPATSIGARSRLLPFGANMAIRAAEQRRHAYDPSLGRHPSRRLFLSGEETDVLRRIAVAGGTGIWLPEATVEHWIAPERQNLDYLRRYYLGIGYEGARRALAQGAATSASVRLRLGLRVAGKRVVYGVGRLCGRTPLWIDALRRGALLEGRLLAHRDALAEPPAVGESP